MARVDTTGGSGFTVDNNVGSVFRTKINQCFSALNSINSGSGDPTINSAFQPHIDTSSNLLKLRNGANNAYITIGNVSQENLGLLPKLSGATSGRDASPANGDFRYNTDFNSFEGYFGSAWATLGNKPAFAARPSAVQAIANTTFTLVSNNTEIFDSGGAYNNSTYKFTVPTNGAGKYVIGGQVSLDDLQDADAIQMSFYLNDAQQTSYAKVSRAFCPGADLITTVHAQVILDLAAGNTVAQYVEHNEGNNQNTVTNETWFYGFKLSGVS